MTSKLASRQPGFTTRTLPIPMHERPVYFDVAQCLRQDGSEDFTADDAARLVALGYTIVWPVTQEPGRT